MAESGAVPAQGTPSMGVDPATGKAYFLSVDPATGRQIVEVSGATQYPAGATPVAAASGNVAAGIAAASLPAAAGKTTYISGFQVTGSGATVAAVVNITVNNIIGGVTLDYAYEAVAGALLANTPLIVNFNPALPASAVNTAITVSCPSLGAGNTNNSVNAMGFQL